jgi:N-acylneuraminate cytidylyltransferase
MNVAIIPARAGSKRIPKKNIKLFAGKPIIAHSIEKALASDFVDQVIVSTDSEEIAQIARHYGAKTPFLRPSSLAADDTPTMPVIAHALSELSFSKEIHNVCLIYPTAPLIETCDIDVAYTSWVNTNKDYIFSVVSYAYPVQRALCFNAEGEVSMLFEEHLNTRSQELSHTFHDAGMFYWGRKSAFAQEKAVFSAQSSVYELSRWKAQDIDTPEDWDCAERLYRINVQGD